jgi:uncharacterized protein YdaU (DUF1376 family)
MSQAPIMPMFVDAMVADTMDLSAEAFGAYHLLLYATWRNNGRPLPDNDVKLARVCRVSTSKWRRTLREELAGFFDISDGTWRQKRLEKEWFSATRRIESARENGSAGGTAKSLKEKERDIAAATNPVQRNSSEIAPIHIHKPESEEKDSLTGVVQTDPQQAVIAWNAMAARAGLPRVQSLTDARKRALIARLKECGGLGGWHEAMRRIEATPWMLGDNDRGWRADFDFVCRQSKFTKLMEGGYDHLAKQQTTKPAQHSRFDADRRRAASAAAVMAGSVAAGSDTAGYG